MVFKRPGNSRDDKSNRPSGRFSKPDESNGRSSASSRKKSPSTSNSKPGSERPRKSFGSQGDDKKPFSSRERAPYGSRPSGDDRSERKSGGESQGPKRPYGTRSSGDDRSERKFGGESRGGKKPYGTRSSGDDRSERKFGGESRGDKKPYGTRSSGDDRYERKSGGESTGARKPYDGEKKRPFSDRPATGEHGKRSFGDKSGGPKRPYSGRPERSEGDASSFSDRPKREVRGERSGRPGNSQPFRKSENSSYNKPAFKTEREPGEKIMRGRKKSAETEATKGQIRLNRYISNAGICSRRKADELIAAGVISVNGEVVSELGAKVDPQKDVIRYNGETLKREKMVYVLLNKPKDYITTTDDPQERRTVMHLVEKASKERIYPIGRLDRNTTGLLLMTNDGDLADKLSHPKNNIVKLYHVELNRNLIQGDLNKIGFGLELEDGLIKPDSVSYVQGASKKEVGIQIHSGKNRIVRRIFEHLGYEVVKLDRAVYANLTKKDLPRGRWRYLTEEEIVQLKHFV